MLSDYEIWLLSVVRLHLYFKGSEIFVHRHFRCSFSVLKEGGQKQRKDRRTIVSES